MLNLSKFFECLFTLRTLQHFYKVARYSYHKKSAQESRTKPGDHSYAQVAEIDLKKMKELPKCPDVSSARAISRHCACSIAFYVNC